LTATDALAAHARDELNLDVNSLANPWQAAGVSAASFSVGAVVPVLMVIALPASVRAFSVVVVTLVCLCLLGALGAQLGGAPRGRAAVRVLIGGALALAVTWAIGRLVGTAVN
jgi:VIT1/CCC1 family predicted Fe2+/Mn2+ transporter